MEALILSLGIKCLRLTEFSESRKEGFLLLREEIRELSPHASPFPISPEEIREHLHEIACHWKIPSTPIHVVLSSDLVFLRVTTLARPPALHHSRYNLLRLGAEQIIPVPLEKVVWDYQEICSSEKDGITIVYAAIKTEFLEAISNGIADSGLKIKRVSVAPVSFCRALEKGILGNSPLLIDIGRHTLSLLTVLDQRVFYQTSSFHPFNFSMLLDEETGLPSVHLSQIKNDMASFLSQLPLQPKQILLMGERLLHLLPFLEKELQLPVVSCDPCRLTRIKSLSLKTSILALTKYKIWNKPAINLLPPSIAKSQRQQQQRSYFLIARVVLSIFLPLLSFYYQQITKRITQKATQASHLLECQKIKEHQLQQAYEQAVKQQKLEEEADYLKQAHDAWSLLINDLQKRFSGLWIIELSPIITETTTSSGNHALLKKITALEIKGLYLENPKQAQVVDDLITQLGQSPFFIIPKNAKEKILLLRTTPDGTAYAYPFTLHLPLKKPLDAPML